MRVASALPWLSELWQRLADQQLNARLGHGLLMVGQEGIGKRLLLREFSQLLLCESTEQKPCGQCGGCHLFDAGSHPDLLMVEPEEAGKQIKIDQIRKVTEFVNTTAQKGHNKVVLLGPAEAMNINASNALLKSLEEPSAHVTLLLYSHAPSSLLATIKSRCQQYSVYPPSFEQGLNWLQANSEENNLDSILRLAKGAPLKALSMLEQGINVQYMQFCQDMNDLIQGKTHWNEVVPKWKNWDLNHVLQWFYELMLDVQKAHAGLPDKALLELSGQSDQVGKKASDKTINAMLEKVVFAQGAHRSQANPNGALLIESLLLDWQGLIRKSR